MGAGAPRRPGSSPRSTRLLCTWTEGAGARGERRATLCHLRELGPTRSPGRGLAGRCAHTRAHAQILGTQTHAHRALFPSPPKPTWGFPSHLPTSPNGENPKGPSYEKK